jgi:hypothetical protein
MCVLSHTSPIWHRAPRMKRHVFQCMGCLEHFGTVRSALSHQGRRRRVAGVLGVLRGYVHFIHCAFCFIPVAAFHTNFSTFHTNFRYQYTKYVWNTSSGMKLTRVVPDKFFSYTARFVSYRSLYFIPILEYFIPIIAYFIPILAYFIQKYERFIAANTRIAHLGAVSASHSHSVGGHEHWATQYIAKKHSTGWLVISGWVVNKRRYNALGHTHFIWNHVCRYETIRLRMKQVVAGMK